VASASATCFTRGMDPPRAVASVCTERVPERANEASV
jgi:hypothetical protein